MAVEVTLLGEIGIVSPDGDPVRLTPGARVVLVLLARRIGDWVTADQLRHFLTTSSDGPVVSTKNLSVRIAELRRSFAPHGVQVQHDGGRYRLGPRTIVGTDIDRARRILAGAPASGAAHDELVAELTAITRDVRQADFSSFPHVEAIERELDLERRGIDDARHDLQLAAGGSDELVLELAAAARRDPDDDAVVLRMAHATYLVRGPLPALDLLVQRRRALATRGLTAPDELVALETAIHARSAELGRPPSPSIDDEPCPVPLRQAARRASVGRPDVHARILEAFDRAGAGRSSCVARVLGAAGHGKSVVLGRAAVALHDEHHALIALGSCLEGDGPLVAFRHVFELAERHLPADELQRLTAGAGGSVHAFLSGSTAPPMDDDDLRAAPPVERRVRTVEAVRRLVAAVARRRPLVLVIDDMQWVDELSAGVIDGLVAVPIAEPLLLVVGERIGSPGHPRRMRGSADVELGAFARRDLGRLVDQLESAPSIDRDALIDRLRDLTGGIPILADEVVRHRPEVIMDGRLGPIELSTRADELLTHRLDALDRPAQRLIEAAAILGMEVDWRHAAEVAALDPGTAVELLDAGVASGVLTDGGSPTHVRFAHALLRDAVLQRLSVARRSFAHHRAHEVLLAAGAPPRALVDHAVAAAMALGGRAVVGTLLAAVEQAAAEFAFAEALRVVELVAGWTDELSEAERCALLTVEGSAAAALGDSGRARRAFERALELARGVEDGELLGRVLGARAALGHRYRRDDETLAALDSAISNTGDPLTRARLGVLRAHELIYAGAPAAALDVLSSVEAELVHGVDASEVRARVLSERLTALSNCGYPLAEREEVLERLAEAASTTAELDPLVLAHRGVLCLHRDRITEAAELFQRQAERADEIGNPYAGWLARAAAFGPAFAGGDLDSAAEHATNAIEFARGRGVDGAFGVFATHLYALAWARGDLGPFVAPLEPLVRDDGPELIYRAALALAYVHDGRPQEASAVLDVLAVASPHEYDTLLSAPATALVTEAAIAVGHDPARVAVRPHLERRDGQHLVLGMGVVDYGPARRYLEL